MLICNYDQKLLCICISKNNI